MPTTDETTSDLIQATRSRIMDVLDEKGMTIVELSQAVGISEGGFHSRFRDGSIQLRILGLFAKELGVPIGHLLPEAERGEVVKRKVNDRPYVEDRLEIVEREVRSLRLELKNQHKNR